MTDERQITASDETAVAVQERPVGEKSRDEYLDTLKEKGANWGTASDTSSAHLTKLDLIDGTDQSESIEQKTQELEQRYGIKIGREGDPITHKRDAKGNPTEEWARARTPSMDELRALEAALKHSEPSNYADAQGNPLKVNFSDDQLLPQGIGKATFDPAGRDHPQESQLNIWSGAKGIVPLDSDVQGERSHDNTSLEEIITHELGHSNENHAGGLGTDAEYKHDLGWVPLSQPANNKAWALTGQDGYLYRIQIGVAPDGKMVARWEQLEPNAGYDENGQYQGKPTGEYLSMEQMADRAVVKPNSDYFPSPEEEMAEGVKDFRLNEPRRRQLLEKYPDMYKAAKRQDQRELDLYFGEGRKIRLPDGTIVDNNDQNRSMVANFESGDQSARKAA